MGCRWARPRDIPVRGKIDMRGMIGVAAVAVGVLLTVQTALAGPLATEWLRPERRSQTETAARCLRFSARLHARGVWR